jgi:hypothetical protein
MLRQYMHEEHLQGAAMLQHNPGSWNARESAMLK